MYLCSAADALIAVFIEGDINCMIVVLCEVKTFGRLGLDWTGLDKRGEGDSSRCS